MPSPLAGCHLEARSLFRRPVAHWPALGWSSGPLQACFHTFFNCWPHPLKPNTRVCVQTFFNPGLRFRAFSHRLRFAQALVQRRIHSASELLPEALGLQGHQLAQASAWPQAVPCPPCVWLHLEALPLARARLDVYASMLQHQQLCDPASTFVSSIVSSTSPTLPASEEYQGSERHSGVRSSS